MTIAASRGRRPLRWPFAALLAGVATAFGVGLAAPVSNASALRAPATVRVRSNGRIIRVPLEQYVVASALAEVSPIDETPAVAERIFEVQSVIARTYVVSHPGRHGDDGFDVCDSTHCQLFDPARLVTSRFAAMARRAADITRGQILAFGDRPAEALFHADCGGHTAAASDVWGGPGVPYLIGEPDEVAAVAHAPWQFDATGPTLRDALQRDTRTDVGRRLAGIDIIEQDESGRAATIAIRGERSRSVRGDDFRAILNRTFGDRAVRSTRFTITHRGNAFQLTGSGFGHGVGLCQVGAAARARLGQPLKDILRAYYPGVRLVTAGA